mgnify:CR=1 FL=1|jgi:1-acyl-sn-glycerol-3-phosphate acyltransferase
MALTILIYTSIVLCTGFYCLTAGIPYIVSLFLPKRIRGHIMRYIILFYGKMIVYIAVRPFIRVRFENRCGEEQTPGVYVCNHRSSSDPFLVSVFGQEVVQVVNGWPMQLKFYGYFARLGEYIDATKVDYETFKTQVETLIGRGVSVVAFPEGTRSGGRFMNKFHSGVFHLARELQLPIYPCCIAGNEEMPTRQFRFKKSGTILIRLLPAISPAAVARYPSAYALKKYVHNLILQETESMDRELDNAEIQNRR